MSRATDFFAFPVLGFRLWALDGRGILRPAAWTGRWERGVNEAVCHGGRRARSHAPPGAACGCGLYGLFDEGSHRFRWLERDSGHALGAIAAWGEMEVHWEGFRARYACVLALALPGSASPGHRAKLERAAERYGVELVPKGRLREVGLRHAQWLPGLAPGPRAPTEEHPGEDLRARPRPRPAPAPRPAPDPPAPPPAEGIWLQGHVGLRRRAGGASLALTPSLTSLLERGARGVLVAPGSKLEEGDAVAVIRSGRHRLVIRTPVSGRVERVSDALARGRLPPDPRRGCPVAEVGCGERELDQARVIWGERARPAYRSHLRSLGCDRALLDSLGLERYRRWSEAGSWGELARLLGEGRQEDEHPLPDRASVLALAPLLGAWIAEDDHLRQGLASLELTIRVRVSDRDAELEIGRGGGVRPGAGEAAADLTLSLHALQLHDYLRGELDLGAALGVDVGLEGRRLDAMLATSLLQRLFPRYREHVAAAQAARRQALAAA